MVSSKIISTVPDYSGRFKPPDGNSEWWEVEHIDNSTLFAGMEKNHLYLRKSIDHDSTRMHSCYEYRVTNSFGTSLEENSFCYPLVIVSGVRKCSTSAMYMLLSSFPKTKLVAQKENCPSASFNGKRRTIVEWFRSLPRFIDNEEVFIDGCIDTYENMKIRWLLRFPNTFYIMLLRDYADWSWSAYNYWCSEAIEKQCFNEAECICAYKISRALSRHCAWGERKGHWSSAEHLLQR